MSITLIFLLTILPHMAFAGARVTLSLFALHLGATPFTVGIIISLIAVVAMMFSVRWGRHTDDLWRAGRVDEDGAGVYRDGRGAAGGRVVRAARVGAYTSTPTPQRRKGAENCRREIPESHDVKKRPAILNAGRS